MSLPISPTTLLTAARAVKEVTSVVADKFADATGFDEVLRGVSAPSQPAELARQLADQISQRLEAAGIPANPPVEIQVQADGSLRVNGDHDQAAAIESLLAADAELTKLGREMRAIGGPDQLTVGPPGTQT